MEGETTTTRTEYARTPASRGPCMKGLLQCILILIRQEGGWGIGSECDLRPQNEAPCFNREANFRIHKVDVPIAVGGGKRKITYMYIRHRSGPICQTTEATKTKQVKRATPLHVHLGIQWGSRKMGNRRGGGRGHTSKCSKMCTTASAKGTPS